MLLHVLVEWAIVGAGLFPAVEQLAQRLDHVGPLGVRDVLTAAVFSAAEDVKGEKHALAGHLLERLGKASPLRQCSPSWNPIQTGSPSVPSMAIMTLTSSSGSRSFTLIHPASPRTRSSLAHSSQFASSVTVNWRAFSGVSSFLHHAA